VRLVDVVVDGFRSVDRANVKRCGAFNVLIGRNNSGKSNILTAVEIFFAFARLEEVAVVSPAHYKDLDHHNRETARPTVIETLLDLDTEEVASIVSEIEAETPQAKHTLAGVETFNALRTKLCYVERDESIGYIASVDLVKREDGVERDRRQILVVPEDAAVELARQLAGARKIHRDIDALAGIIDRIDPDDWRMVSEARAQRGGTPPSYAADLLLRRMPAGQLSREWITKLTRAASNSSSYEEFQRSSQEMLLGLQAQLAESESKSLNHSISAFAGDSHEVPDYVRHLLHMLSAVRLLHIADRRRPIGEDEASKLLQLKMSRGKGAQLRTIQETVSSLLGIEIDAYASDEPAPSSAVRRAAGPNPRIRAELDADDFLVQVNGSGVREALRVILDVEFERPQILLVEEPEVHLHPALEVSMLRYLKLVSRSCQVFLTTHSTNFLDMGDLRNVYLVNKTKVTNVQHLEVDEVETEIPRELGVRLSSLFMFDRLVFVEGPTDELVLRELAATLGVNLASASVGFIAMGGVRNFTHFAAEATISFLARRQVDVWFVLDRDERSERDVERLVDHLGERAHVRVLGRRELENYLIDPEALSSLIGQKLGDEADPRDPRQIEAELREVCEELQEVAVERCAIAALCRPTYPDRRRINERDSGVDFATAMLAEFQRMTDDISRVKDELEIQVNRCREEVSRNWPSGAQNIVPGDLVLDHLFQRHGVRFRKKQDAPRLAALIARERIPRELADVLREIGAVRGWVSRA